METSAAVLDLKDLSHSAYARQCEIAPASHLDPVTVDADRTRPVVELQFAASMAFGVFISVGSLILEELEIAHTPSARDLIVLMLIGMFENVGCRQINNIWRVAGTLQHICGSSQGWGETTRKGFSSS